MSIGNTAAIAQLGERQTEDLKVPGSIPGLGKPFASRSQCDSEVLLGNTQLVWLAR